MEIVISWRFTFTDYPAYRTVGVRKKKSSQMKGKSGPLKKK
jgi:hypothetical protein